MLLNEYCEDIEIIADAGNVLDAKEKIEKLGGALKIKNPK